MSIHYRFQIASAHLDHRVYAIAALLAYELPKSMELPALNVGRAIIWG